MSHPYRDRPDHQFWNRSVSNVETHLFNPAVSARFQIAKSQKVITAGSCFAQHISRRLSAIGFNFHVAEQGDGLTVDERARRNYGVFSARYGNIYTAAQFRQLFEEAFGSYEPADQAWVRSDGRYIDPYRQQVEPDGFASADEVRADRKKHLAYVREMFENADILVFTLGLTEAWRSRRDGAVFSQAPGVVGHRYDDAEHEFVNFGVDAVCEDLHISLSRLKSINPDIKVIITVSPVPLAATYEDRSVLVSTTYSKSALRVAAEQMTRHFDWVDYFPSFEIITGSPTSGLYYESDYREVNALGVAHVMRCFLDTYTDDAMATGFIAPDFSRSLQDVVCDEEVLMQVRS